MHGLSDRLGGFVEQQHRHSGLAVRPIRLITTCNALVGANAHRRGLSGQHAVGSVHPPAATVPRADAGVGATYTPYCGVPNTHPWPQITRRGCPPTPTRWGARSHRAHEKLPTISG